jgi:hypothetical protein
MEDVTNVPVDPIVSENISNRCIEEKRKAEIRQEMKMASARAKANKNVPNEPVEDVKENIIEVTKNVAQIDDDYITKQKLNGVVENINKSFSWIEKYIQSQNVQNAKVNKFISDLSKLVEEYNKK